MSSLSVIKLSVDENMPIDVILVSPSLTYPCHGVIRDDTRMTCKPFCFHISIKKACRKTTAFGMALRSRKLLFQGFCNLVYNYETKQRSYKFQVQEASACHASGLFLYGPTIESRADNPGNNNRQDCPQL